MPAKGAPQAGCRDRIDLKNANFYSRRHYNGAWCVTFYAYYFEKDVALESGLGGHTHDWENIAVWTKGEYVSASQHKGYEIKERKDVRFSADGHPLLVYHNDGASTRNFRFATEGDEKRPENHMGVFWRSMLVGWNEGYRGYEGFPGDELRERLMGKSWGGASLAIRDGKFAENIKKAKPKAVVFDAERDFA